MLTLLLALTVQGAAAKDCELIGLRDVTAVEAPAVIVLGERHGVRSDLNRAMKVALTLNRTDEVTIALEAVHEKYQPVLDRYAAAEIHVDDLPHLLEWEESWGYPWKPYEQLVTGEIFDMRVVAAGLDLGSRPDDVPVPIPPRYIEILRDAMGGHDVPIAKESQFVQAMAWRDHRIVELALEGWNGQGYLIIVAGRGHVEGGKGVQWQAARTTDKPVEAFVLAWARAPCYPGDRVWRPGLFGG